MGKLRKCFLRAVCLIAFATIPIYSQMQQSIPVPKEWIVNLPSSPLSISPASKVKAVRFDSRSTGNIVGFRLGCVAETKDSFTILEVLKEQRINLPAAIGEGDIDPQIIFMPISEFDGYRSRCEKANAKVAVIEVEFSDGGIWKAKR